MQHVALGHVCIGGGLADITSIDIGELDLLAGHVLDLSAQAADRGLVADIGRRDVKGKQVAERVDGQVFLWAALTNHVRLPVMAAVGSGVRPLAWRSTTGRCCASVSKQRDADCRCNC